MRTIVLATLLLALVSPLLAEDAPKAVPFKQLQEYLPAATVAEFERKKPEGESMAMNNMAISHAKVEYVREKEEQNVTIRAEITDYSDVNVAAPFTAAFAMSFEREADGQRTRTLKVKDKYKGIEEVSTDKDNPGCKLTFAVSGRVLVHLEVSGSSDLKLIAAMVDSMALDKLAAATAAGAAPAPAPK